MLKARWSRSPWSSVTVQRRQYSPCATPTLSSCERLVEVLALGRRSSAVSETIVVTAMISRVTVSRGESPRARAK